MPQRKQGSYAEETWVESLERTTSGEVVWDGYGPANTLVIQLDITAATADPTFTPSITVDVEDSIDGGTRWRSLHSFGAKTAAGVFYAVIEQPFADKIKVKWAISGTGARVTFSVKTASQIPSV